MKDKLYGIWFNILCFFGKHDIWWDLPNRDGRRKGSCINCGARFKKNITVIYRID